MSAPPGTGSGVFGSVSHRATRELWWREDLKLRMMWWGMLGREKTCVLCACLFIFESAIIVEIVAIDGSISS